MAPPQVLKPSMLARAASYNDMQIRDKVTTKEESAGPDQHDAGSHGRALTTVTHEISCKFRRNSGRGQER